MIAYSFDTKSHKFTGIKECQRDPLESQAQGHDVWLLPAHCTFAEPLPEKDGFDRVWNGTAWEYQEISPVQPEPPAPTKEEQEQARANAYAAEIDPLHARKARKTILGEWTDDDETEYVAKVKELSAEITERYPYPTDPITE